MSDAQDFIDKMLSMEDYSVGLDDVPAPLALFIDRHRTEVENDVLYLLGRSADTLKAKFCNAPRYPVLTDSELKQNIVQCMQKVASTYMKRFGPQDLHTQAIEVLIENSSLNGAYRIGEQFRDNLLINRTQILNYDGAVSLVMQSGSGSFYVSYLHDVEDVEIPVDEDSVPYGYDSRRYITLSNEDGHMVKLEEWDTSPIRRKMVGAMYSVEALVEKAVDDVCMQGWKVICDDRIAVANDEADVYVVSSGDFDIAHFRHPDIAKAWLNITEKSLNNNIHPYFLEKFMDFLHDPYHMDNAGILDKNMVLPTNYLPRRPTP